MECKDVTTSLTLTIPVEFHDKINEIRKEYDRAYPRWMPHINFFFPFVDQAELKEVCAKLEKILAGKKSFKIKLNKVGNFKQGSNYTYHLVPESSKELEELFVLLQKEMGFQSGHKDFHPHMTLGQAKKKDHEEMTKKLEEWLKGTNIEFTVDKICILARSKTDNTVPFSVFSELKF
jgi:2'-5' RNA ligase